MGNTSNQEFAKGRQLAEHGYSLVELLIVVIIVMLLATIAIPNLLKSRILANEASAVSSIRQINTAEGTYASSWGAGYAAQLQNLGGPAPCTSATPANACLIDPLLSTGTFTKSGYTFGAIGDFPDASVPPILSGFEAVANPVTPQVTGVRSFCSDESGVIKFDMVAMANPPAQGQCAAVATVASVSGPVGN